MVGSDGAMLIDTVTPDGARVDEDGRVIVEDRGVAVQETQVYYEDPNSTETKNASTQKSSTAGEIKGVDKDKQYELYEKIIIAIYSFVLSPDVGHGADN